MIKAGLIHNGPPTYGPDHFCGGSTPPQRKLSATELFNAGFPAASKGKTNRLLGLAGEVPAFFYNGS
jgi:hypothetical protein